MPLELPAPRVRPGLRDHLAQRDLHVQRVDGRISICSAGSPNKGTIEYIASRQRPTESFHQLGARGFFEGRHLWVDSYHP